ncbi:MAG: swr1 complex component [Bogoriella megaspora]|nr:MAG: swr1 complex component [Bogoriella megaspora]
MHGRDRPLSSDGQHLDLDLDPSSTSPISPINQPQNNSATTHPTNGHAQGTQGNLHSQINGFEQGAQNAEPPSPQSKKRKLDFDPDRTSLRAASPPWKKVAVDGPTSFVEDGRRKSSRVNALPLELQPQGDKRQTRAALQQTVAEKLKHRRKWSNPDLLKRHAGSPSSPAGTGGRALSSGVLHALNGVKATSTAKSSVNGSNGRHDTVGSASPVRTRLDGGEDRRYRRQRVDPSPSSPSQPRRAIARVGRHLSRDSTSTIAVAAGPPDAAAMLAPAAPTVSPPRSRIRIRTRTPSMPILHAGSVPPRKKFESMEAWLNNVVSIGNDLEESWIGNEQATQKWVKREANARLNILDAARPGGLLSEDKCSLFTPALQEEPPKQHGHFDYVVAHAVNFQRLLHKEHAQHMIDAKRLAHACAAKWRERQPKSEEEITKEQEEISKTILKQVCRDLQTKWNLVAGEIRRRRQARWEEQQQILANRNLDQILDHSTRLLDHRRLRRDSGISEEDPYPDLRPDAFAQVDADETVDWDDIDGGHSSDIVEENGQPRTFRDRLNIADSVLDAEEDDQLTAEQLRQKYAELLMKSKSHHRSVELDSDSDGDGDEDGDEREDEDGSGIIESQANEDVVRGSGNGEEDELATDMVETVSISSYQSFVEESHASARKPDEVRQNGVLYNADPNGLAVSDLEPIDTGTSDIGHSHWLANSDAGVELEEVDETLLDDSEESSDMDDDTSSVDGYEGSEEETSEEGDEDAEQSTGLLGFLSNSEITAAKARMAAELEGKPAVHIPDQATGTTEEAKDLPYEANHDIDPEDVQQIEAISADATSPASPATSATVKPSEIDSASSVVPSTTSKRQSIEPTQEAEAQERALVKPSFLLRGNLREYQHEGLDWLAKLYADRTNGILADEMGLGKTIQSIALLAHLATEHEVWGPHLVVVPTSVMLNWEVEFKKFLPGFRVLVYYGTAEERKVKRKGWSDDSMWNVIITSYQLILQDHQAFRVRNWHYMILDEAHNIKNFNSQRWQTLLRFKTQARLLLTGTPLQNNLTELWSLLWFITPGGAGMSTLDEFSRNFKLPAEQIFDKGNSVLDSRAKEVVGKLHHMLRPYLLRRLKAEVEKQMPAKYEHVVYCRLSKRQRQLYDGFMSRADTKATLASGNYMSIINCLMSLRKVCNHPDLFETRQIVTSFAMPKSAIANYEIKELMIRKRLLAEERLESIDLQLFGPEHQSKIDAYRTQFLSGTRALQDLATQQSKRLSDAGGHVSSMTSALSAVDAIAKHSRLDHLRSCARISYDRIKKVPICGADLVEVFTFKRSRRSENWCAPRSGRLHLMTKYGFSSSPWQSAFRVQNNRWVKLDPATIHKNARGRVKPERKPSLTEDYLQYRCLHLGNLRPSLDQRSQSLETTIAKFGCITPTVVTNDLLPLALTSHGVQAVQALPVNKEPDPFHEARIRLSIAFPDKRLLQYDCGKLQQLDKLLRQLQTGGHRALIFTQMTKVLDILEQFLNIHGHRYLRLDGSTKIEQRQALTERFNSDNRILAFILSSRSGGLGINLTGADTVIFYDLDWNPAMDKQCQDRCHRIGQTRDVHIYRFVSEYTIEANILRKSNQKRLLDNVVIQEGEFNTDYFNRVDDDGAAAIAEDDEAGAAMDKVFGGAEAAVDKVLESVEDREDVQAAKNARKEEVQTDVADFAESGTATQARGTPKDSVPPTPNDLVTRTNADAFEMNQAITANAGGNEVEAELPHIDTYMLRYMDWELPDMLATMPADRAKKTKRGKDIRIRR